MLSKNQVLLMTIAILSMLACKKESASRSNASADLLSQAKTYFTDSVLTAGKPVGTRASLPKTLVWEKADTITYAGAPALWVPLSYGETTKMSDPLAGGANLNLSAFSVMLFYRSGGSLKSQVITSFPDSTFLSNPQGIFSGLKLVEDWQGHSQGQFLYRNGLAYRLKTDSTASSSQAVGKISTLSMQTDKLLITTTYITGYNYSPSDPDGGVFWIEEVGTTIEYEPDESADAGNPNALTNVASGGGGAASATSTTSAVAAMPPDDKIADLLDYLKCFTSSNTATYSVSVCVDQPDPGTRTPWTFSLTAGVSGQNPFDVGHAFLIFSESDPTNGVDITRNVGLYPSKNITPNAGSVTAAFGNDQMHEFNVSASFSTNSNLFWAMISYMETQTTYNLSTNNCTTFVLNTLDAGHIYLPSTIGSWLGGMGNDPGDLGQDILISNAPGIEKNTVPIVHMNSGTCTGNPSME